MGRLCHCIRKAPGTCTLLGKPSGDSSSSDCPSTLIHQVPYGSAAGTEWEFTQAGVWRSGCCVCPTSLCLCLNPVSPSPCLVPSSTLFKGQVRVPTVLVLPDFCHIPLLLFSKTIFTYHFPHSRAYYSPLLLITSKPAYSAGIEAPTPHLPAPFSLLCLTWLPLPWTDLALADLPPICSHSAHLRPPPSSRLPRLPNRAPADTFPSSNGYNKPQINQI